MKHLPLLALFFIASSLFAQNKIVGFAGAARAGTPNSGGAIFESSADGAGFSVLKNFVYDPSGILNQPLTKGPDECLYGVSNITDGSIPCIFFFKIEPVSGTYTLLHKFEGFAEALCAPVWGQDGYFYFCAKRTENESRKMLRIAPDGQNAQALTDIPLPVSSYMQSFECFQLQYLSEGAFVVVLPGARIARYSAQTNTFKIIKKFEENIDGRLKSIEVASNGIVYGQIERFIPPATLKNDLFKVNIDGTGYTLIQTDPVDFYLGNIADMLIWDDSLLLAISFLEYPNSGIFKLNLNSGKAEKLYQLPADIYYSWEKLIKTSDGKIAFPSSGGVWTATIDGLHLSKISKPGSYIRSQVIEMPDNRLYATTLDYTFPRLLSMNLDGTGLVTNYTFNQFPAEGARPGSLIKASDGNYYGAVRIGGQNGKGYIYTMHPDGSGFAPILQFSDLDVDFDYAVFFEGSDGRLYFGARRYVADSWGNLRDVYELHSVNKSGGGLNMLYDSYGAATTCVEGHDGRLNWIDDFSLSRMKKDKTGTEIKWNHFYGGVDEYNYAARLHVLANGDLFGGVDYYFDDGCSNVSYSNSLSFFLHPNDDLAIVTHDMFSKGYVPGIEQEVMTFANILKPDAFYLVETGFSPCSASLSGGSTLIAERVTKDSLLWGRREYTDGRFDLLAVDLRDKACAQMIPWREEMGYQGRWAFQKSGASTLVSEVGEETEIRIGPNPASHAIRVDNNSGEGQLWWNLVDFTGKTLQSGHSGASAFDISLDGLPVGIYVLVGVNEKSGHRFSQKIVKQ